MVGQATSATIIQSPAGAARRVPGGGQGAGGRVGPQAEEGVSLIVQLSKPTNSSSGNRAINYRDGRNSTQASAVGSIATNPSNVNPSPQQRTIMTAVAGSGTVRTIPANSATNVTAGALKITSQVHRWIANPQQAQVAVVQKSQSTTSMHKSTQFMDLQTRKTIVPATANSKLNSEVLKESGTEKPSNPATTEDKRPSHQPQIPLMYQYVLQEHNYVALPPASPPISPLLHHPLGAKLNGAQSTGSPSSLSSEPHGQHIPHTQQNKSAGLLTLRPAPLHGHHPPAPLAGDDAGSDISSDVGREAEPEGEETETAPEAEGEDDSVTRCICDFEHDDGYMICCDKCSVWQHVDCMGIDRMNIPDEYMCERCQPRRVDKMRARNIQCRKREEFFQNDSSSDSSSSSTDSEPLTGIANTGVVKKRGGAGASGRRKSEPLRKPVIGGVGGYRQRRDSARDNVPPITTPRRQPTPRKKSTENKRAPRRRKQSKGVDDEKSPDAWEKSPPLQSLRQWIDNYEEAVTNHYSPELRARLQSIRLNGVHSDWKVPSHFLSGSATGLAKCRLTLLPNGTKILVTTCSIAANQPIIELRGKYMLSQQHRALSARNTPPPGPFLFFHRLPLPALREATEVCVDCRTYGNDARFVRRSCKPNTEVRHCVEKGTLHLFLVTICSLEKNAEITIRHQEGANLPCCCGNPKECSAQSQVPSQPSTGRKNGVPEDLARRRRGRRRTVSSSYSRDLPSPGGRTPSSPLGLQSPVITPTLPATPASTSLGTPPQSPIADKKRRNSPPPSPLPPSKVKDEIKVKEEVKTEIPEEDIRNLDDKADKIEKNVKVEKEERSPSPPPTPPTTRNTLARRSSTANRQQTENETAPVTRRGRDKDKEKEKKEDDKPGRERRGKSESDQDLKGVNQKKEPVDKNKNKSLTREERKMEAIMKAFERMEKLAQKKQEAQVRQQRQKSGEKNEEQAAGEVTASASRTRKESTSVDRTRRKKRKGRGRANIASHSKDHTNATNRPQRRTRLHLRSSERDPDEADPETVPENDQEPDPDDATSDEETQSPRSLLLDSNVKTPPPSFDKDGGGGSGGSCSSQGSTPPLSSACLLVAAAVGPLAPGFKFPKTKKGLLTSWFKTPDGGSAAEPGKAALSYMKPLSPEGVNNNLAVNACGSAGFAKKRWLRQAISEDHCDSPISRGGFLDASECVTPLKKRRLARESMSADQDAQLADSPANPESESDQPTQDEDTMDGPALGNADTEASSHDEGSQSAEDLEGPAQNTRRSHLLYKREAVMCSEAGTEADAEETEAEEDSDLHPQNVPEIPDVSTGPSDPRKGPRDVMRISPRGPPHPTSPSLSSPPLTAASSTPLLTSPPPPPPVEAPATKRKLSISEYRQRKQRISTDTLAPKADMTTSSELVTNNSKHGSRSRSSSTSSTTSSLSSDDDSRTAPIMNKIRQLDMRAAKAGAFAGSAVGSSSLTGGVPGLSLDASVLSKDGDAEEKKGGSSWSSAPTLVERQRENLTERLRREFGLFVDDEEAERVRKQALLASGLDSSKEKDSNLVALGKKKGPLPPPPPPGVPPSTTVGFMSSGGSAPSPVLSGHPSLSFPTFNAAGKSALLSSPSSHGQIFPPAATQRPTNSLYYPSLSRP